MINKKKVVRIALLTSLGLSVSATSTVSAQEPNSSSLPEVLREAREQRAQRLQETLREGPGNTIRACFARMNVTWIDPTIGGAHFAVNHEMIVVGPVGFVNLLIITPLPGANPWVPGDYVFTPGAIGYENEHVAIAGHPGGARPHAYIVEVEAWDDDGCPTQILLTGSHTEGLIFLDPGHARAQK